MTSDETPPQTDPLPQSDDSLRMRMATAFHEAGHAVMALIVGRTIQKITIADGNLQSGGRRLGLCQLQSGRRRASSDDLEDEVLILLAGMVGESHFTGRYCTAGAALDLRVARQWIESRAGRVKSAERLERRLIDKTEAFLDDAAARSTIRQLAEELDRRTTVSGRMARHLYEQALKAGSR